MPRKGDIQVYGPTILVSNDNGARNIFVSSSAPTSAQGQDGDIWIQYA
jgi:hypothetical protein